MKTISKDYTRTRNFYKRDKQGYYYIPELQVLNEVRK